MHDWPAIELIDDVAANRFRVVIQRPPADTVAPNVTGVVTTEVADPVADPVTDPVDQVLAILANQPLETMPIQERLGSKHRPTLRTNYHRPALSEEFIEMTLPDKPTSHLQRCRVTKAGRAFAGASNVNGKRPDA